MSDQAELSAFCPKFHHAVELIGRRWTGAIVRAMLAGNTRFSDIAAVVPGLSDRLLSERLKELEHEGIVEREVIPETPVKIVYSLSPKGHALFGVITAIADWSHDWDATPPEECARQLAVAAANGERQTGNG